MAIIVAYDLSHPVRYDQVCVDSTRYCKMVMATKNTRILVENMEYQGSGYINNGMNSQEQIARAWIEAFNSKNLDALLALYDERAKHFSPKLKARLPESKGLIEGKLAMRAWWADAFERMPSLHYRLKQLTIQDNRVFIEYLRQALGEEDLDVAEYLEIENQRIIRSRVYHG